MYSDFEKIQQKTKVQSQILYFYSMREHNKKTEDLT